jgi:hypothetical protein
MAVISCLLLHGCGTDPTHICTGEFVPGICVSVIDATTGQPAACGATGWVIENGYSQAMDDQCQAGLPDSLQSAALCGAWERAGIYTVFIVKAGYQPWSRGRVVVRADECHVHTVALEARLERDE